MGINDAETSYISIVDRTRKTIYTTFFSTLNITVKRTVEFFQFLVNPIIHIHTHSVLQQQLLGEYVLSTEHDGLYLNNSTRHTVLFKLFDLLKIYFHTLISKTRYHYRLSLQLGGQP